MRTRRRFFHALLAASIGILLAATAVTVAGARGNASQQPLNGAGAVPRGLDASQFFVGTPWTGLPGVRETVADLMARDARLQSLLVPTSPRERRPEQGTGEFGAKGQNPAALQVSRWPEAPAPPPGQFDRVAAPQAAFSLVSYFAGTSLSESGFLPPDSNGAVGPTQVFVASNGRFKVFTKTGAPGPLDITDSSFFASVSGGIGISDPHVRFDRLSGRWFITEINVSNTSNRILIAVSSGDTITSASSFTFFQFAHDAVGVTPNIDTGHFADYDTLGVDASALYIGVNEFVTSKGAFQNSTGYVVNKANLIAGSLTVTAFRGLALSGAAGPSTPQGVSNDDPAATEGYFIGVDNAVFSQLDIRRVTNPGGTPAISGDLVLTVPVTALPVAQPAQGSSIPLDSIDDRLFGASITKNRLTGVSSLWTAHNVGVVASGVGSGSADRNASRWYQIDNLTGTPTLTQAGTAFDPSASGPLGMWIPTIGANGQGAALMGTSIAGVSLSASAAGFARVSGDPAGSLPYTFAVPTSTSYNVQTGVTTQRWGDYSQVVVDPSDDQTLWTFQEICDATNSWGVYVVKILAPPPASPVSTSPSTVPPGVSSFNITITGSQSSGSAFFDPGAGFTSRIAASVSGGVTVNSVTFVDPTHVTINVSTVGASAGAKNVTVVNPDAQQSTGAGLFTIAAVFTDDPLTPGTPIKAVHLTELRSRIDAVRSAKGLPAFSWGPAPTAGVSLIRAQDVLDLRQALREAYVAAGMTPPSYTPPDPAIGAPIRASHIAELRAAVKAIE
jgi:hypothetical protein